MDYNDKSRMILMRIKIIKSGSVWKEYNDKKQDDFNAD